jgi:hypothetical protein
MLNWVTTCILNHRKQREGEGGREGREKRKGGRGGEREGEGGERERGRERVGYLLYV